MQNSLSSWTSSFTQHFSATSPKEILSSHTSFPKCLTIPHIKIYFRHRAMLPGIPVYLKSTHCKTHWPSSLARRQCLVKISKSVKSQPMQKTKKILCLLCPLSLSLSFVHSPGLSGSMWWLEPGGPLRVVTWTGLEGADLNIHVQWAQLVASAWSLASHAALSVGPREELDEA